MYTLATTAVVMDYRDRCRSATLWFVRREGWTRLRLAKEAGISASWMGSWFTDNPPLSCVSFERVRSRIAEVIYVHTGTLPLPLRPKGHLGELLVVVEKERLRLRRSNADAQRRTATLSS